MQNTEDKQVTIPGIIVQDGDPRFVSGVYWGRDAYLESVFALVDQDGREVHEFTWEELEQLQEVKNCDITINDIVKLVKETMQEEKNMD